ncbi:hypothetical protein [Bacillus coahuilensis]|uniref:hypothetical protein n=1 Tax=Bacillus coahuilensis TaxID=408580 RepID=UPI0030B81750
MKYAFKKDCHMIGLILSIIVFNLVAFQTNKRLSKNQMIHVWAFTIVLQMALMALSIINIMGIGLFK